MPAAVRFRRAAAPRERTRAGRAGRREVLAGGGGSPPTARSRHPPLRRSCAGEPRGDVRECRGAPSRLNHVGSRVKKATRRPPALERREAAQPATGHVREEDPLDRILLAVGEDVPRARAFDETRHAPASLGGGRNRCSLGKPVRCRRADPHSRGARRLRRGVLASGRPAAGEIRRRDLPRGSGAAERRARHARVHGRIPGRAGVRSGDADGLPDDRDRLRGARPARGKALSSIGSCGALQPDLRLGDLLVAISAVPADSTAAHLVGEPHASTADWELVHGQCRAAAKHLGRPVRGSPSSRATSSTTPTTVSTATGDRGILAVGGGRGAGHPRRPSAGGRLAAS